MPSIARVVLRFTKQVLVYWEKIADDQYGKPTFAQPIEVNVRWEDKEQEVISPDGRKIWSKAYILLIQPLLVGSWVWLGSINQNPLHPTDAWLTQLPTYPNLPTVNQGGREVRLLRTTPDIKNQSTIYEVFL